MSQLDESVASSTPGAHIDGDEEKNSTVLCNQSSTANAAMKVADLTSIPQEVMEVVTALPENKGKYDLIRGLGRFERAMCDVREVTSKQASLILQIDSNDKRHSLMKANIRSQQRAKENLCDARDNIIGLIGMASAKVNGVSKNIFSKGFNLCKKKIANIVFRCLEECLDSSTTLTEQLLDCPGIQNDPKAVEIIKEIIKTTDGVCSIMWKEEADAEANAEANEDTMIVSRNASDGNHEFQTQVKKQRIRNQDILSKATSKKLIQNTKVVSEKYEQLEERISDNDEVPQNLKDQVKQSSFDWEFAGKCVVAAVVIVAICAGCWWAMFV